MKPHLACWFLIPAIISLLSTTVTSSELKDYELMAIVEEADSSIARIVSFDRASRRSFEGSGFFVSE